MNAGRAGRQPTTSQAHGRNSALRPCSSLWRAAPPAAHSQRYRRRASRLGNALVANSSSAFSSNQPPQPPQPPRKNGKNRKNQGDPRNATPPRAEQSAMVNREVVLFLLQLELDSRLQRALTYDRFDEVKELRDRRNKVDGALRMMQSKKGYGCGSRRGMRSDQFGALAPAALSIRAKLSKAIEEEDYAAAAALRDKLAELEEQSAEANMLCPVGEPAFSLGQMIVHSAKGYRGVICGWDFCCCEDDVWKRTTNAGTLVYGTDQVFYHVLVDVADWPVDIDSLEDDSLELDAPVAYVAEELLDKITLADFDSDEPIVNTPFQHPYSYLMFLGMDGGGNMIPCRQLRERFDVEREDDPFASDSEYEEDVLSEMDGGRVDDELRGIFDSSDAPSDRAAGIDNIPGIDMRSLSDNGDLDEA